MTLRPIINALKMLEERAPTGELAFLCLNGKAETHIRDLVAFEIARSHKKWAVKREVGGIDLVVENIRKNKLEIEFKVGYANVVARRGKESTVVRSALADVRKRGFSIVNCVGLMNFRSDLLVDISEFRNPGIVRRTLKEPDSVRRAKSQVRKIWNHSTVRTTIVDCGIWNGVGVDLFFVVARHNNALQADA